MKLRTYILLMMIGLASLSSMLSTYAYETKGSKICTGRFRGNNEAKKMCPKVCKDIGGTWDRPRWHSAGYLSYCRCMVGKKAIYGHCKTPPIPSYRETCSDCMVKGKNLICRCKDHWGRERKSILRDYEKCNKNIINCNRSIQ